MQTLAPEDLIACYRRGVFPMAESREDDGLFLVDPVWRCVLPLDRFHLSRRLARTLRSGRFQFRTDTCFDAVIDACAAPRAGSEDTWINPQIRALYTEMHRRGHAHSVEAFEDGVLAGGLYGVALGGAFFGESMFSRARDASKAALAHLAARLRYGGFVLLDAQFQTPHLQQFGAETMSRKAFRARLAAALDVQARFDALRDDAPGEELARIIGAHA